MSRNSDKRKQRKKDGTPKASTEGSALDATIIEQEPVEGSDLSWSSRFFSGPEDIPRTDSDGSLARALFHVTCLLSMRDATKGADEHLARVASEVARIVGADTVTFLRLEGGDDMVPARLTLLAAHGLSPVDKGLVSFDLGDGIAGQVALSGKLVRVEDAPRDPRFQSLYGQRTEIGSMLAVPLLFGRKTLGVLTASRREVRGFHAGDEDTLATIAQSIAQDLEQTRLFQQAVHDPGTGLYSRLALLNVLPREVESARRYQTGLSLVLLDIDGLRDVNEQKGRAGGDQVLAEVGRRLAQRVRSADLPVRFGGDEFALLMPMTDGAQAKQAVLRLAPLLSKPAFFADLDVTLSLGVASLTAGDEDALGLILRADDALAAAKQLGGGQTSFATAPVPVAVDD